MRIYDPSKTQQTLFILEFKSFSVEIEQKTYDAKYRTPGHTNKQRPTLYLHRRIATSTATIKRVPTCTMQTSTRITAVLYETRNTLYKKTCLLRDFRDCGQPSTTGLSAYSYPL